MSRTTMSTMVGESTTIRVRITTTNEPTFTMSERASHVGTTHNPQRRRRTVGEDGNDDSRDDRRRRRRRTITITMTDKDDDLPTN